MQFDLTLQLAQNALLEFLGSLAKVFDNFDHNFFFCQFVLTIVDIEGGHKTLDNFLRLLRRRFRSNDDLVDVVVVQKHVSVFEVNESVFSMVL